MRISPILAVAVIVQGLVPVMAQTSSASEAKNLIRNGGFESSFRRKDLWDGVDKSGYLSGERGAVPVLTTSGSISDSSMPISVTLADMNNDGKIDIVTMDVLGYLRIFFNSGTPTEPKFTIGELAGVFLTRTASNDPILGGASGSAEQARLAPRIYATDLIQSGKKDLILGNYIGEVLFVPNSGTVMRPEFKQPQDISKMEIPTTEKSENRWGNVFAPVTWDWDGDGREDLLLGEGSYSANNIHLLINQGSGAKPKFDENNRSVLAFGDGLEQLTPAVVDYNGDGQPDLLVAERSGRIAVYLNKGEKIERGKKAPELPFTSFVSKDGSSSPLNFRGIATVATGDLNGDGLFDIVVGKTNGRIALVLNTGTKTEPKFGSDVELKGNVGTDPMAVPSGWDVDYGIKRGNYYGFISVVSAEEDQGAQPAEGKAVVKAGYLPSPNKIMAPPTTYSGALGNFTLPKGVNFESTGEAIYRNAPANFFSMRQLGRFRLKTNTKYRLSFKVKGDLRDGRAVIGWTGYKKLSAERVEQGDRGSVVRRSNEAREEGFEEISVSAAPQWSEKTKDFMVKFRDKDLKDLTVATTAVLEITFTVPPGKMVYFDDFQIVEVP